MAAGGGLGVGARLRVGRLRLLRSVGGAQIHCCAVAVLHAAMRQQSDYIL